jgi:hypothetical protein
MIAAQKLGGVMLRRPKDQPGIRLVMLNEGPSISPPKHVTRRVVLHMHDFAKDMLTTATRARANQHPRDGSAGSRLEWP